MDPIDPRYAPPTTPEGPPAPASPQASSDPIGWTLLAVPVAGGIAEALLPSTAGTVAGYVGLVVTLVLIGIDADRHRQRPGPHVWKAFLLWLVFYPVYMHQRAKWGAPRRLALAVGVALFYTASLLYRPFFADRTRVEVSCKASGKMLSAGFDCSLVHTAGAETVGACWNLVLTCANGSGGSARACGRVAPRQTTPVRIEQATFVGEKCDRLTKMEVTDVEVKE